MNTDTKIIVGLSTLVFGLLHLLLLAFAIMGMQGESQSWAVYFLELPVGWTWPGGDVYPTEFRFWAYFGVVGSLLYGLVVGVPVGFMICGVRRSFKRMNNEKQIHDA